MKQAIYADLAKRLEAECGVPPEDLIVSCNQNTKEDWSFGFVLPSFLPISPYILAGLSDVSSALPLSVT
jgi:hypothetical protein